MYVSILYYYKLSQENRYFNYYYSSSLANKTGSKSCTRPAPRRASCMSGPTSTVLFRMQHCIALHSAYLNIIINDLPTIVYVLYYAYATAHFFFVGAVSFMFSLPVLSL